MKGHFFTASSQVIEAIASQTKSVDAVLGYLVLKMSSQGGKVVCTGGAPSLVKHLGLSTRYKADEIIKALRTVRWGEGPGDCAVVTPEVWNQSTGEKVPHIIRRYPAKVLPPCGEEQIALPNTLVKGVEGYEDCSPLRQLRGIEPKEDRLDATRLMLKLYQHHSFTDYGGVDPKVVRRDWLDHGQLLDQNFAKYFSRPVNLGYLGSRRDQSSDLHFWLAQSLSACQANLSLMSEISGSDTKRFWKLFDDLRRLNLFYEVATVFDGDPNRDPSAEICYPLFVFDRNEREQQDEERIGRMALEIQNCAERAGVFQANNLTGLGGAIWLADRAFSSWLFPYAAGRKTAKLITVFRLRFRAHTHDTGSGIEAEHDRLVEWKQRFTRAFPREVGVGV